MDRRRSAFWMEQTDERILEHLSEENWSSPSIMASLRGFSASRGRIRERCKMLQQAGLIYPIHADHYELTTWGAKYLVGEIDAAHQPVPVEARPTALRI